MIVRVMCALVIGVIALAVTNGASDAEGGPDATTCVRCHSDAGRLKVLGHPDLVVTPQGVERQAGMTAPCEQCHRGNPGDDTVDGAHRGLLGLSVVMTRGAVAVPRRLLTGEDRKSIRSLQPKGAFAGNALFPRITGRDGKPVPNPRISMLQWHDKDLTTVAYNPGIAEKTCGNCHAEAVKGYSKTEMGKALTRSSIWYLGSLVIGQCYPLKDAITPEYTCIPVDLQRVCTKPEVPLPSGENECRLG